MNRHMLKETPRGAGNVPEGEYSGWALKLMSV
jgi:hypothetical protein